MDSSAYHNFARGGGSMVSFGQFTADGGEQIVENFRKRLIFLKSSYEKIRWISLKMKVDEIPDVAGSLEALSKALKSIIRVEHFTFITLEKGEMYVKSTLDHATLDTSQLQTEFKTIVGDASFGGVTSLKRFKKLKEINNKLCKKEPYNYALKINRNNVDGSFPTVLLLHLDSKYMDAVLSDHGMSSSLINLVIKYSDLVVKHDFANLPENSFNFTSFTREFMDDIIINLETLMLPKLFQVVEDISNQKCVFIQDADLKGEDYQEVSGSIFIGLRNHNLNIPQILNVSANEEYPLLNSIMNAMWIKLRNWRVKEMSSLYNEKLLDTCIGNYVLSFNSSFELIYTNGIDRNALSTFFIFPETPTDRQCLTLSKIVKHETIRRHLFSEINSCIEQGTTVSSISRPLMDFRFQYDIEGIFKIFSIVIRHSTLYQHKEDDFYSNFEFVVQKEAVPIARTLSFKNCHLPKNGTTSQQQIRISNKNRPPNSKTPGLGRPSKFHPIGGQEPVRPRASTFKKVMVEELSHKTQSIINKELQNDRNDFLDNLEQPIERDCGLDMGLSDISPKHAKYASQTNIEDMAKPIRRRKEKKKLVNTVHFHGKQDQFTTNNLDVMKGKQNAVLKPQKSFDMATLNQRNMPSLGKHISNPKGRLEQIKAQEAKESGRVRRSSVFTQYQDLLYSSIAMEYVPSHVKNSGDNVSILTFKTERLGNLKVGEYDKKTAEEQEIVEIIQRKKEKLERKVEHFKKIPTTAQVMGVDQLTNINDWNLSILDLDTLSLVTVVRDIFNHMGIFKRYQVEMQCFVDFVWTINYFYSRNANPFHNFYHGVTVAHSAFYFLENVSVFDNLLTDDEKFAFVVGALGHDLDHRGRSNAFEINTSSQLAIRYHDISPLEQHHAAILFKILTSPRTNLMQKVNPVKSSSIRKMMIENIKNTDMSVHFEMLAHFKKQMLEDEKFGLEKENKASMQEDKIKITNLFLHTADLCGPAKNQELCVRWSKLVAQEFTAQSRDEMTKGLPITEHFKDLHVDKTYYKSESGFLQFIVVPLYELVYDFSEGDIEDVFTQIKANQQYYSDCLEKIKVEEANEDHMVKFGGDKAIKDAKAADDQEQDILDF